MKPLYTQKEFNSANAMDKLPCQCYNCKKAFTTYKKLIKSNLNGHIKNPVKFCSQYCKNKFQTTKKLMKCVNCGKEFYKVLCEIKKSKSGNHFCSKSCSATYNNKHKSHGTRRSKLEIWLEDQLTLLYPKMGIHFNRKDTIGSELDIFIPNLNLAIELNGIFHYEPIYGNDKLHKIQENDISKSKACFDSKIDLCIIDTSQQKYVKPKTSQKYLDIITNIVNERLLTS